MTAPLAPALTWMALLLAPAANAPSQENPLSEEQLQTELARPELAVAKKHRLLSDWLQVHRPKLSTRKRLRWELRLAVLSLGLRRANEAREQFEMLERRFAALDRELPELREMQARCRLGLAQSNELAGHKRAAHRLYLQVTRRWPRTRYERVARIALRRLKTKPGSWPTRPLPLLQQARRLDGERILPPKQGPWLLVMLPDTSGAWPKALATLGQGKGNELPKKLRVTVFVPGNERLTKGVRRKLQPLALAAELEMEFVPWPHALSERVQEELGFSTLPLWCLVDTDRRVTRILPSVTELR
ncbi:MAG: hypothetical protein CSA62_06080 [Planctomycetota bacterium]|nr:MAG: hypothetical protein CSA62_06080 [Planctomycetota bacterium]